MIASPGSGHLLTRKEAELLGVLIQNAGRCMSRKVLLETVWGYKEGTRTRTLDVHIRRLRKKLGPDGTAHIKTVLRGGYLWAAPAGNERS